MKGLTFLMWNFIMIYPLVKKLYRENLKISAITGRLPVASVCTTHDDFFQALKS